METFVFHPEICFEDTNLVGNVYFANFVRWQNECRDHWLKNSHYKTYCQVFRGEAQLLVSDVELQFYDPAGATLGDLIEVEVAVEPTERHSYKLRSEIRRRPNPQSVGAGAILAAGSQRFLIVAAEQDVPECTLSRPFACTSKLAYVMDVPVSLEMCRGDSMLDPLALIRLQGKCREQFLAIHAPGLLSEVASGTLALHTTRLRYTALGQGPVDPADLIRLEMRLSDLKSRLTIQFTYSLVGDHGNSPLIRDIAIGEQVLCCKRRNADQKFVASLFPVEMLVALSCYTDSDQLRSTIELLVEHQSLRHRKTSPAS